MARRPKNPINDIVNSAGGWLGGVAKGVYNYSDSQARTFTNPYINVAGRAVGKNPNLPVSGAKEAITNTAWGVVDVASGPIGRVAAKGVTAAGRAVAKTGVVRKAADVAWEAKYNARMMMPVTTRKFVTQRNQFAREKQQLQGMLVQAQAEAWHAGDLLSEMGSRVPNKTVKMANEFITQYQDYNPVFERAENKAMSEISEMYRASNAPQGMRMEYTRKDIRKQLLPSAQDLYRDALERLPRNDPMRVEAFNQLQTDIRQAKAFQQAEGIMARKGIETTRRTPALSNEQRLAKEYRDMVLQDRVEAQVLRSMLKRSKNKNPKRR
jgi:hypothetical protein